MSEPAFVTRDQATAPPPRLLLVMARAAYESDRPSGSSRPPFEDTLPEWQDAMRRSMTAAIQAAEAEGYTITRGTT